MYAITADATHNLVEVVLGGLLSVAETDSYIADLRHEMARHRIHAGYGFVLDVSECTVQTQDMLQAMGRHMATMPKAGSIAIVSTSQLARRQIRRLFDQPYARIVASVADARAWVSDRIEPPGDLPDRDPTAAR